MGSDVDGGYRKVGSGPQSVLGTTLLALGSDRPSAEAATGLDAGVHDFRSASDAHEVSAEDAQRITGIFTEASSSDPGFWAGYVRRCTGMANGLTETVRSLVNPPAQSSAARLLDQFTG